MHFLVLLTILTGFPNQYTMGRVDSRNLAFSATEERSRVKPNG